MPKKPDIKEIDLEISKITRSEWALLHERRVGERYLLSFETLSDGLVKLKLFIKLITNEVFLSQLGELEISDTCIFSCRENLEVLEDYVNGDDRISKKLKDCFDSQKVANEFVLGLLTSHENVKEKYCKLKDYIDKVDKRVDLKGMDVKQRVEEIIKAVSADVVLVSDDGGAAQGGGAEEDDDSDSVWSHKFRREPDSTDPAVQAWLHARETAAGQEDDGYESSDSSSILGRISGASLRDPSPSMFAASLRDYKRPASSGGSLDEMVDEDDAVALPHPSFQS